jgi:hypothetical protein
MPREAPLPPQWKCLEGRVQYVQRVSDKEYCCTCPVCGGVVHQDGEWPDRCRLFADDHPRLWCRHCGLVAYPDQYEDGTYRRATDDELEMWRKDQIRREEERKRSAERAIAHLRDERLWERYHRELTAGGRLYWRKAGIPDAFIDWWRLGWARDQRFFFNGQPFTTDAASIPIFGSDWEAVNIKLRLQAYPDGAGKYRYEVQAPAPLFLCDPETPIAGDVVAVEGEKKAMVAFARLDTPGLCVVGLPGVNPSSDIIKTLQGAERLTLVVDPGAEEQGTKIAEKVGAGKCRLLVTSAKLDDAILRMDADKYDIQRWLRQARKVA